MRLVRFGRDEARSIERYASVGFALAPLVRSDGSTQIAVAHLGPDGRIGRHPAVVRQLLAVVSGSARVSGADEVEHALETGEGAVWEVGEEHETRTDDGLVALIVEGEGLEVLAGE